MLGTAETAHAHRRLQRLYEVSKLLTRFENVEQTLPEILTLVSEAVPLSSAILMLEERTAEPRTRTIIWHADGVSESRLSEANAHAKRVYAYLAKTPDAATLPPPESGSQRGFVLLPLVIEKGSIFGALQVEGAIRLDMADLAFVNAVVNQLAIALDRRAIVQARQADAEAGRAFAEQNERTQRFLSEVSALLMSSLEYEQTLIAVARAAVPVLADVCLIDEIAEDGRIRRLEVVLADPTKQAIVEQIRQLVPPPGWEMVQSGESVLLAEISSLQAMTHHDEHAKLMHEVGVRSIMSVPLATRGRTFGALTFMALESERRYGPSDLAIAEEIGRRAALAIDNAQLYDQAQHAIQARQDLLAIVSHDLGNPLGNILMSAEFLQKAIPAGQTWDRLRGRAAAIERSGERMKRLIMDLLDLASIEAGELTLEMDLREVATLVEEVLDANATSAAKKELRLESELPEKALEIKCDRERLIQVLGNLIGNAIKFTPEGGTIKLSVERRNDELLFSVADSGVGIRPEDLPHVFDRYWQVTKTGRRGTGLGLSIAEGIVARHGGRIWVESTFGRGTTFFFTIPITGNDQPAT